MEIWIKITCTWNNVTESSSIWMRIANFLDPRLTDDADPSTPDGVLIEWVIRLPEAVACDGAIFWNCLFVVEISWTPENYTPLRLFGRFQFHLYMLWVFVKLCLMFCFDVDINHFRIGYPTKHLSLSEIIKPKIEINTILYIHFIIQNFCWKAFHISVFYCIFCVTHCLL